MLKFYYFLLKNNLSPDKARLFFNISNLSKNKRNRILLKCGIKISHEASIVPPFHFECGNINIIGDVLINFGCVFLDQKNITIQDGTMLGPNVTLATVSHYTDPELRHDKNILAPINIGKNVWVGAGAVILPGVNIGDNSVIGANSVVNSDVPANVLYAGSPAKFKKTLSKPEL